MSIPLNGRIAIVENELKEALPLMKAFSKNQIPYVFYKGDDATFLPDENSRFNDIRILFLDLNLIDKAKPSVKQVKSVLYGVLKKVISKDNYPYSIIYWSKQENDYSNSLEELFQKELKDRAPISIERFIKSSFFTLSGEKIINNLDLFREIQKVLAKDPVYGYLLNWENNIHISADKTLQEIFSSYHNFINWSHNANHLVNKLGVSYAGSNTYNTSKPDVKLKSSYSALNIVFNDTVENYTNNSELKDVKELPVPKSAKDLDTVYNINKKLLISDEKKPLSYSGTVIEISDKKLNSKFEKLLDNILQKKAKKADIIKTSKNIWLNVTPLCDTVQGKYIHHRMINGLLVEEEFCKSSAKIFYKNEAVFISPSFAYDGKNYSIVLDFKEFFTKDALGYSKNRKAIFRVRQQLLAEVQSRLARHVNRQGVLFLV
ncbi:hypothetical protein HME9304_03152 [Flagellimonas maritima]|uniref:Response receiver domain-containing protein n=1 Tax=Flagellimonas maritima TaxID=1383885 RepID=A0A2Z4LWM7_9FLAO|nr:hypothetical protein [Allomuricauda aurantiaca]AWX46120.1 hypothetical protein HME9304_03152 [Allomuricauda aurantiaca]